MKKKNFTFFGIVLLTIIILFILLVFAAANAPTNLIIEENVTPVYDEGVFTVNWTSGAGDAEVNYTIYLWMDGNFASATLNANTSVTGYSWSNTTEANYTFTIEAVNGTAIGTNSTNISMYVDTTSPTATFDSYTNTTAKKNTEQLTLNISVADASSGLTNSGCNFDINGTNETVMVSSGWCNTTTLNLTGLADGNHSIDVYVNDTVNNVGVNQSLFVQVYTTPPTASLVINEFVSNPSSGNDWVEIYNKGASSTDLTNCELEDNAANTLALTGNITAGNYEVFEWSNRLNNGGDTIILTCSSTEIDRVVYGTNPTDAPIPGVDESTGRLPNGQDTDVDNVDFTLFSIADVTRDTQNQDTTPPTATFDSYTNATLKKNTEQLTLNISVADASSGLTNSGCNFDINGTNETVMVSSGWCNTTSLNLTGLVDGNQTISVYVNDSANNVFVNNSFVVQVDTTPPTATFDSYTNATLKKNTEQLTLNISVADASSGLTNSGCNFDINGTNETVMVSSGWCNTTSLNLTGLADGNQTISVYVNDSANNVFVNNSFVVQVDTTPPIITFPFYTNATIRGTSQPFSLSILFDDAISGIVNSVCLFDVNGTNQTVEVSDGWCNTTTLSLAGNSEGNQTINVWANDTINNLGLNNSYIVQIDAANPTAILGPTPVDTYNSSNSSINFNISCSDNRGLNAIAMHGNWSNGWHANYTNSSYTNNTAINVTTDGIEDGYYIWGIGCVDVGTNENWSANRTITIDTIAPTASVTCTPSSVSAGTNVVCTCLGTDATSGINSSLTTANSTRSTSSVGSFTYTCDVTDNAGNTASTTATYTVTSSSGSGVTSSTWTNTYSIADTLFEKGHSKELGSKARMKFKVNNEYHHVGVKSISGDKATIEIASDPVEILLGIGEDAKLDLTEDNFYDLYVLLNSISNNKVNLTIQKINEEIPEEIQDPSIDTSGELLDQDDEDQDIGDKKSFIWLWILGIILILIMLIIIGMRKKYKK